ncbi:DNA-3-methyladenine glycosylase I [Hahella sp. CCB-MM4]|uniref:DNA-3-methyladenine glycosylase I n=1 Tax=Hahella sp. (strain CCB-MM4) TaxID=1926491 RepID=UPI000B9AE32B|nr:DNA-3-methyladenine glycosylase I [Hahella sp. CCB-MM4]OZG72145.1 DNA-3-methyladenine glycosylase I [Hahella sp. CCB-MM4]
MSIERCPWCGSDPLYVDYHDRVWGRPVADSRVLFEKLCLDGQQAGLSWITILKKQKGYEEAFAGFDPAVIALWGDEKVEELMLNPAIVRNRLKIQSVIKNARGYLELLEKGKDFSCFLWDFLDGRPLINHYHDTADVPTNTELSDRMSKALKKAGFSFVGSTIVYAFMQAVGMVNDHLVGCPQHMECSDQAAKFSL